MSSLQALLDAAAIHASAGRSAEALAAYRAALEIAPSLAEVHHNVGALLYGQGDLAGAEQSFGIAERHKPQWSAPSLALGHLYFASGRYGDAEQAFQRARMRDPDSVEALGNLGLTLQRLGRYASAQPHLDRARELNPRDTRAWFALRTNLLLQGRLADAVEDFLRFERDAPLSAELVTTGLAFSRFVGGAEHEQRYLPLALDWPYRPDQAELAAVVVSRLQYCDVPRDVIGRFYATYNGLQQKNGEPLELAKRRSRDGVIRLGYLSADFRAHVMGRLMLDVIAAHDPSRCTVHLYSLAPAANEDAVTADFVALAKRFVRLHEIDDLAAARSIAADELDVLVDLMGHSSFSRPGILLRKPARVIITHLGYHGCVGLEQIDFKLTDAFADPPDAAAYQIEAPLVLDGCVLPVRRVEPAPEAIAARPDLGIADDAIVFGAFASLLKLSPRCLTLWRRILERVPEARLALSPLKEAERPIYLRRLLSFGIPAERIVFIPAANDDAAARARYRLLDAVLDTVPYTGGDSTAAALDMAVPVVTRSGDRHAERMSYSLLAHLGVTETVAWSDEDYVAIACRLASDAAWRARIAASIRAKLPASGIADPRRYARSLEFAYERALAAKRCF